MLDGGLLRTLWSIFPLHGLPAVIDVP